MSQHDINIRLSQQIAELTRRLTIVEGQLEANRSSLESNRTPTYVSNVTAAPTHSPHGRDSVGQPNETESSLTTDTLGVAETSKETTPSADYIYYRIYAEDGAIPSKTPFAPGYPFLGRIKVRSVPPPRNAKAVKCRIIKAENIKLEDGELERTSLFLTPYNQSPMGDADKVTILNGTGPGSTPQEPLALVAKMSDRERSAVVSDGRGGLASAAAEADSTRRYVYYLLYANGEEMPSKVANDPEEPSLGRIRVDSITPPHSSTSIKQCISRVERNRALALWHANLFADTTCDTPLEGHISLRTDGPGLSPNDPMAIVSSPLIVGSDDGRYAIKNRAADIYWNSRGNNPITTVYFYFCASDSAIEEARKDKNLQWDIKHDIDGISIRSVYAPSSWAGANLAGSTVPIPWRLIPADGKFYYLTTDTNLGSRNPRVPAVPPNTGGNNTGTMATLNKDDYHQMWEFIPV